MATEPVIVAMTGATGAIYGVRVLERLVAAGHVVHLVISPWARKTLAHETEYSVGYLEGLAEVKEGHRDLGAAIASGSFQTAGMIIVPCTVKTAAAISVGLADNLIGRAADVILKEQKKLVLVVRETPLSAIHLENLLRLSRLGASIVPPVPAFYNHPQTLDDIVDYTAMRAIDQLGLRVKDPRRWQGVLRMDGDGVRPDDSPSDTNSPDQEGAPARLRPEPHAMQGAIAPPHPDDRGAGNRTPRADAVERHR